MDSSTFDSEAILADFRKYIRTRHKKLKDGALKVEVLEELIGLADSISKKDLTERINAGRIDAKEQVQTVSVNSAVSWLREEAKAFSKSKTFVVEVSHDPFKITTTQVRIESPRNSELSETERSNRLQELLSGPRHMYHMSVEQNGREVWRFALLTFEKLDDNSAILIASAEVDGHRYQYRASLKHEHLMLEVFTESASGFESIDLDVSTFMFPLIVGGNIWYGAGVIAWTSASRVSASTIAIISQHSLLNANDTGVVLDPEGMESLISNWESGTGSSLLRLPPGVTVYRNWNAFGDLLSKAESSQEPPDREALGFGAGPEFTITDVRVSALAFTNQSIFEDLFRPLVAQTINVKILLTDPVQSPALVTARNKCRPVKRGAAGISDLAAQVKNLETFKRSYPSHFDYATSNVMPCGFVLHSRRFVIFGPLLAHCSYAEGPMIVFDRASHPDVWTAFLVDWECRWADAHTEPAGSPVARTAESTLAWKFEHFFSCPINRAEEGRIIVQTDAVKPMLGQVSTLEALYHNNLELGARQVIAGMYAPEDESRSPALFPPSRFWKCRYWLPKQDLDGALRLRDKLREQTSHAPEIALERSVGAWDHPGPFRITMGLGFTLATMLAVQGCDSWMRTQTWYDWGDALLLHKDVLSPDTRQMFQIEDLAGEYAGFCRILPRGGDPKAWITQWEANANVEDYALVLRHTHNNCVHIVLAGFSEDGTLAAAIYFAEHWHEERWFRPAIASSIERDFLVVLSGHSIDPGNWAPAILVTPDLLLSQGWKRSATGSWSKSLI